MDGDEDVEISHEEWATNLWAKAAKSGDSDLIVADLLNVLSELDREQD